MMLGALMENVLCSWLVMVHDGMFMAKCPKCGKEVSTPKKTWKMAGKPDKSGKRTELTIGLFEHCGKSFRSTLGKRKI
jgi:predicted RNA-binding Zn-ribbon protein involved in translation (DUF1610 family)